MIDLDTAEDDRLDAVIKHIESDPTDIAAKLFRSERVISEVSAPKLLFGSFSPDKILVSLPYMDRIYVEVCPACLTTENFPAYKTLVGRGAIVPILTASYRYYPAEIAEFTCAHDHVSRGERYLQRYYSLVRQYHNGICSHCIRKQESRIERLVAKDAIAGIKPRHIRTLIGNLSPFLGPDADLVNDLEKAARDKDGITVYQLFNLSWAVRRLRTAQAFQAPEILNANELAKLPRKVTESYDLAAASALRVQAQIADGLALRIPLDVPLEAYIDISNDIRPSLQSVTGEIAEKGEASLERIIMRLNGDVERLMKSTRYRVLEAGVEAYSKNTALVNAAAMGAAAGILHGWAGCAAGAATSGAVSLSKKLGAFKSGPAVDAVVRRASVAVQPAVDKLVAAYTGTSPLAVRVLSLRKTLSPASAKTAVKTKAITGGRRPKS